LKVARVPALRRTASSIARRTGDPAAGVHGRSGVRGCASARAVVPAARQTPSASRDECAVAHLARRDAARQVGGPGRDMERTDGTENDALTTGT
jgi:hypothetical protein